MARQKSRRAGRRVKDKWKSKSWYRIVAPEMFDGAVVGETPAAEPEELLGRTASISMQDLTGDFSKVHIKAEFKVNGVRGGECVTRFMGHDMTSDYIRRLTRRRRSKIDSVFDTRTKEGYQVRIKVLSVTDKRINSSIKQSLRKRMKEILNEEVPKSTLPELVSKMIFSSLAKKIKKETKEIYPLKRVEIRKSEVRSVPSDEELDERIISQEELDKEAEEKEDEETSEDVIEEVKEEEKNKTKPEVIKEFQGIEGVGPTMAEKLYDGGYKSTEELKEATKEDLKDVEGVGPAFSKKIIKALHPEEE
ncbi:MAG: 30S ribosomal protein S3ae [Thermoplasmatota archaeon]